MMETGRTARSGRAAVAAHGGGGWRLAGYGNPARAHHEGDDGPSLQGHAVSHQPQPWRGDGPEGLSLRRRSARAGRSRDSHYPGAARARGTGALRQGRRAFRRRAELRVRGGRGRRRRGPAGRDARHRQALRHGGDGPQFGRVRQYRGGAVPHVQSRPSSRATGRCCRRAASAGSSPSSRRAAASASRSSTTGGPRSWPSATSSRPATKRASIRSTLPISFSTKARSAPC